MDDATPLLYALLFATERNSDGTSLAPPGVEGTRLGGGMLKILFWPGEGGTFLSTFAFPPMVSSPRFGFSLAAFLAGIGGRLALAVGGSLFSARFIPTSGPRAKAKALASLPPASEVPVARFLPNMLANGLRKALLEMLPASLAGGVPVEDLGAAILTCCEGRVDRGGGGGGGGGGTSVVCGTSKY